MGLGGRLCTASEKKKRCTYPESCNYRVGAGGGVGIGRSGHTFRQRGKKKMKCFCLKITDINTSLVSLRSQFSVGNV